jgi:hypothetical protein
MMMKTDYKYILFIEDLRPPHPRKTKVWGCYNKKSNGHLASVQWFSSWRQYIVIPCAGTIFSAGCLRDIAEFIDAVNTNHKENRGKTLQ